MRLLEALDAASDRLDSPTDLLVYVALARRAAGARGELGRAWPSTRELAAWCCLSQRAVKGALSRLRAAGLVVADGATEGGVTVYRLPDAADWPVHDVHGGVHQVHGGGCTTCTGGCTSCTGGVHVVHGGGAPRAPLTTINEEPHEEPHEDNNNNARAERSAGLVVVVNEWTRHSGRPPHLRPDTERELEQRIAEHGVDAMLGAVTWWWRSPCARATWLRSQGLPLATLGGPAHAEYVHRGAPWRPSAASDGSGRPPGAPRAHSAAAARAAALEELGDLARLVTGDELEALIAETMGDA